MKNAQNKTIEDFFAEADIHDLAREKNGGLLTCAVALVVLFVESLLVYLAVYDKMAVPLALIAHFVVSALLGIYARMLKNSGRENRFAYLLFLVTATTGPFGAAGIVMSVTLYFFFIGRNLSFQDWYDSIFPSIQSTPAEEVYSDLIVGRDESSRTYSVISFLDVISYGNEAQKRQALAKMTSNFHPNFAAAFRKALNSDSNTIRVQAATAISKIESQFTDRLMKIARVKAEFPEEPVVVKALAEHYDNYAYTGLLDSDREQTNRQKAYEHYMEYLQLEPGDVDVRTRIGRILMREKEYEKACDWFNKCIQLGHSTDTISQWYSESLFQCGRYDELRRYSMHLRTLPHAEPHIQPVAVREALLLWQTAEGRI